MSKQYSCDLCNNVFNYLFDFTGHQNKKACGTTTEIKMDDKAKLISEFKKCYLQP